MYTVYSDIKGVTGNNQNLLDNFGGDVKKCQCLIKTCSNIFQFESLSSIAKLK